MRGKERFPLVSGQIAQLGWPGGNFLRVDDRYRFTKESHLNPVIILVPYC